MPNLIEVQKMSFAQFLQTEAKADARQDTGLQNVFKSAFPIKDFSNTASLEFVKYSLLEPKYTVDECHQKGMTYAAPIKLLVRLIMWDKDHDTGAQSIRDIKEQEVYFGEIPLMTDNGSFIINGTERVIVSQLHRSPGVFFEFEKPKGFTGKILYTARVIPYHGSWLDFEFDQKDWLYVRIDKRRKMPVDHTLQGARVLGRGDAQLFLPERGDNPREQEDIEERRARFPRGPEGQPRHQGPAHRRGHSKEGQEVHQARHKEAHRRGRELHTRRGRGHRWHVSPLPT